MAERLSLYKYQQDALESLLEPKKHIVIANTGMGKTAIMMKWLEATTKKTGKRKVLVVTTPSKRDSGDMQVEADMWCPGWRETLEDFTIISWHGLLKWYRANGIKARNYVVAYDECARAGGGVSSGMGKAFLNISELCKDWSGFTGTPGDTYLKLYPFFQTTGYVRNKTEFMRKYCQTQSYRGFPEIVGYNHTDLLDKWWRTISVSVDSSEAERQLPSTVGVVEKFKTPTKYNTVKKTRKRLDNGEFIDTCMGMCMYLRQLCYSKEKQQWLSDFLESLGTNCVFFCNFIEEEEKLSELAKKTLPKGAKVWRIDGSHHEIPTPDTIGPNDIIVAHYQSGGEALNLQFINYTVFVSPNYSYSQSVQAKGRTRRIGQKRCQHFYWLQAKGTIEDEIYKCLSNKRDFAEKVWYQDEYGEED